MIDNEFMNIHVGRSDPAVIMGRMNNKVARATNPNAEWMLSIDCFSDRDTCLMMGQ